MERITVRVRDCQYSLTTPISRSKSGSVDGGDWDKHLLPLAWNQKINICLKHWVGGLSWRDAGAYDHMILLMQQWQHRPVDGLQTLSDIVARYDALDRIFDVVSKERRLRTAQEVDAGRFREQGGIFIHIDRYGRPIFGLGGAHRLAMARILELDHFPAEVGVVHADALPIWRSRLDGERVGFVETRLADVPANGFAGVSPRLGVY